jgi:xylulokinase
MNRGSEMDGGALHPLVMTYDFGTTSLKAALVDRVGRIVAHATAGYPLFQPRVGWAEQNPRLLWEAGAEAGRRALEQSGLSCDAVRSTVFVAPWKGIIPVGGNGDVLRDAMIWMDSRATDEADELNKRAEEFIGTGQEYWPRLMWLKRHEPELWETSQWIMGVNTYLKWMATGAVVTEPSDDFIRSERPSLHGRYQKILAAAGLADDIAKFPPSTAAGEIVGHLTEPAAAHLGLAAGIPVFGGFGDLPAVTAGANALVSGATHIYLGTSSWLLCVLEADEKIESPLRVTLNRRYDGALYCLQSACLAFDWIVDQVYGLERAVRGDAFLDFVNAQVAEIPPGSNSLLATHWLTGELPPFSKQAKGVYLNLTTVHDRRHMVRAMMESICYSHRMSIQWFESQARGRLDEIKVVGGGASSPVWMQMLADVLGRTVVVPDAPRFVGAVGAYRCTLSADDQLALDLQADRCSKRYEPQAGAGAVYDRLYKTYRKIHPALLEIFTSLNGDSEEGDGLLP